MMEKNKVLNTRQESTRVYYLDIIKIVAIFSVLFIHTVSESWSSIDTRSASWQILNFYDSFARVGVPLFLMVTGSIYGNRETVDTRHLWHKNILRFVTALIFWQLFYVFSSSDTRQSIVSLWPSNKMDILKIFLTPKYHLWYVYMIIFIYMVIPALQFICKNEKVLKYFVRISLIFCFVIPTIINFPFFLDNGAISNIFGFIKNQFYSDPGYSLGWTYVAYFFIGCYLSRKEFDKKLVRTYAIAGAAGGAFVFITSALYAWKTQQSYGFYGYDTIGCLLESCGIYILVKYYDEHKEFNDTKKKIIERISKDTFGIYLIHIFVLENLGKIGVTVFMCNPAISVPLVALITFLIS